MSARKQFTPEFTREAVQLVESGSHSASPIVRELVRTEDAFHGPVVVAKLELG